VQFVYEEWIARFPEFTGVTRAAADVYFLEAEQYCQNDQFSPAWPLPMRKLMLYYLTAHIAFLAQQARSAVEGGGGGMVGRINSASEGSVSVGSEYPMPNALDAAWYTQTPYGAAYWALTARWRRMRYYPGIQPFYQGYGVTATPATQLPLPPAVNPFAIFSGRRR
jgi:hypothetical protein